MTNSMFGLFRVLGVIAVIMIIIGAVTVAKVINSKANELDFACSSNLKYENSQAGDVMNTNAQFIFRPDGKGMVTLDGEISGDDYVYKLSRTIIFNYEYFGRHTYTINEKKSTINKKDTLPENMFEEGYFSADTLYISPVNDVNNTFLIGSRLSPAFMCVKN